MKEGFGPLGYNGWWLNQYICMKKTNKGNKGGFGEFTPGGIAKKKLQDKRDEQTIKQADNELKDCGCC